MMDFMVQVICVLAVALILETLALLYVLYRNGKLVDIAKRFEAVTKRAEQVANDALAQLERCDRELSAAEELLQETASDWARWIGRVKA
jgi:chemotaxis regulatin CheY-phosphate phosphatase CheZ